MVSLVLLLEEVSEGITLNFYKTSMWKYKRLAVLKRDGYCCQECKRYGKNRDATVVHHVNPLTDSPELRLQSWNL